MHKNQSTWYLFLFVWTSYTRIQTYRYTCTRIRLHDIYLCSFELHTQEYKHTDTYTQESVFMNLINWQRGEVTHWFVHFLTCLSVFLLRTSSYVCVDTQLQSTSVQLKRQHSKIITIMAVSKVPNHQWISHKPCHYTTNSCTTDYRSHQNTVATVLTIPLYANHTNCFLICFQGR